MEYFVKYFIFYVTWYLNGLGIVYSVSVIHCRDTSQMTARFEHDSKYG